MHPEVQRVHDALYGKKAVLGGQIASLRNDITCLSAVSFTGEQEDKRVQGINLLQQRLEQLEAEMATL